MIPERSLVRFAALCFCFCTQVHALPVPLSYTVIDKCDVDGPTSIVAADVDGDGDMDIICASERDHKISWFENLDGKGNFGPQKLITRHAKSVQSIQIADFDGDADLDIAAASLGDDKIAWYRNQDGQGNFSDPFTISDQALGAKSVSAADVDGDGDTDIVAASVQDNQISWFENLDGLGHFGAKILVSQPSREVRSVSIFDADHDGDLDLLVCTNGDSSVACFLNLDGLGHFSAATYLSGWFEFITHADVDGNGWDDIIAMHRDLSGAVTWFRNDEQGFHPHILDYSCQTVAIAVADVQPGGNQEIIFIDFSGLVWAETDTMYRTNPIGTWHSTDVLTCADLDQDGDLDVIAASAERDMLQWYANTDDAGQFAEPVILSQGVGAVECIWTADLDGDERNSIITLTRDAVAYSGQLSAYTSDQPGNDTFSRQTITDLYNPMLLCSGDIDQDGQDEIININRPYGSSDFQQTLIAYHRDHIGGLLTPDSLVTINDWRWSPQALCICDADEDGDQDILVVHNSGWAPEYQAPSFFEHQNGSGKFKQPDELPLGWQKVDVFDSTGFLLASTRLPAHPIVWAVHQGKIAMHCIDLDGDGDLDGLLGYDTYFDDGYTGTRVDWYERSADGGRMTRKRIDESTQYGELRQLYPVDWDGDGDLDIIAGHRRDLLWYENLDGRANFSHPKRILENSTGVQAILALDYDRTRGIELIYAPIDQKELILYSPGQSSAHVTLSTDETIGARLLPNYPNPFNPSTQIPFYLEKDSPVELSLLNLRGQHVQTIFKGHRSAGHHVVAFTAGDMSSGVYYVVLQRGSYREKIKCVLVR